MTGDVRWALNPNKSGIPAATKGRACWRIFSNYCCTLPPKNTRPRLVGDFSPTDISHSFAYGWRFFSAAAARFLFGFSPFSLWKRSYFEVLIKFKKIGHTICDPYQIFKKIFSLRHHGVKSFWTKVGDFSPMPRLLGWRRPRSEEQVPPAARYAADYRHIWHVCLVLLYKKPTTSRWIPE